MSFGFFILTYRVFFRTLETTTIDPDMISEEIFGSLRKTPGKFILIRNSDLQFKRKAIQRSCKHLLSRDSHLDLAQNRLLI